ncbi:hypothetical protein ACQKWADRAFT_299611 [Trichoderma austrokoningii]
MHTYKCCDTPAPDNKTISSHAMRELGMNRGYRSRWHAFPIGLMMMMMIFTVAAGFAYDHVFLSQGRPRVYTQSSLSLRSLPCNYLAFPSVLFLPVVAERPRYKGQLVSFK